MTDRTALLKKYMPEPAAPLISTWIDQYQAILKISKSRSTKLGDYRHPYLGQGHRISVNFNLNPYAFLITLVHEFAHLVCYNQFKNKVKPHGSEWKGIFKILMDPFMAMQIFPNELQTHLVNYLINPAASSCSDVNLMRILEKYDMPRPCTTFVEHVLHGALFFTPDGRCFKKGEKLRKRFKCEEVSTCRMYLFNPLAKVKLPE